MLNEQIQLILGQVNATEMDRYVFMASNGSATTTYCAVVAPWPWADGGPTLGLLDIHPAPASLRVRQYIAIQYLPYPLESPMEQLTLSHYLGSTFYV
jgi:hypothetical protein